MSRKNCICLILAVIFSAVLLNLLIFVKLSNTGEYIQGTDVFGNEYLERRDTVTLADSILSLYDTESYPGLLAKLTEEKNAVAEYIAAYEYKNSGFDIRKVPNTLQYSAGDRKKWTDNVLNSYSYTYEQAIQKNEQLDYCISRLNYALDYTRYAAYVSENSDNLLSLSVFDPNSFAVKNAVKTKRDFYGLGAVRPSAESDMGIISLFTDGITDIIAVVCAVCSAAVSGAYLKKQTFFGKAFFLSVGAAVTAGIAVMYICNAAVIYNTVSPENFLRPVQSVQCFKSSCIIMNTGTLTAVRILFKAAACACIFFTLSGIITASKKSVPIIISLIFIFAELIFLNSDTPFSTINFFNFFQPEKIFGVYGNLNIFGNAVSPQPLFIFSAIVIFSVPLIFSVFSASSGALSAREAAEHEYYNEVSRKYEETRKIRHDMNNHLTALEILINEGKINEAKTYLGEISAELTAQKPPAVTGRPVLDALLFGKVQTAANYGIKLDITVDASFPESISDYDLCGIFGNILDNAIEACEKCDRQKFIRLSVKKQMDMLFIFSENTCLSEAVSPVYETSKPDKAAHGYGIRRIKQLAEKHGGTVKLSAENNLFSISVLIQK